jgi:hypothetical protein
VTVVHANGPSESFEYKKIQSDSNLDLEILPGDKIYTFPEKDSPKRKPILLADP